VTPRPCPCGLPEPFESCCGRYLGPDGAAPPTAEALMRSRYTAFARGDAEHLLRTWHPDTRPVELDLDPSVRWTGLEIVDRAGGGLFDTEGTVEFRAHHREGPRTGVLHERSRFVRDSGRWLYLDGAAGRA
jgi:SEC-C motif-containing protein